MDAERLSVYLSSLRGPESPLLRELREIADRERIPIIRRETASLLSLLVAMREPEEILEVGTAIGYSALVMCEQLGADARITTIEKYSKRIPAARENFRRAGESGRITLIEGDAAGVLPALAGPYDFIFMDAAKGQYLHFLPEILRLMPEGGVLVTDNVLQGGTILETRFALARRDRTIHARMREYLYQLTHHPELQSVILPVGDGVALSVRRKQKNGQKKAGAT